jgi:hypothetical protein
LAIFRDRLCAALAELGDDEGSELSRHVARHDRFGALDRDLVEKVATFTTSTQRSGEQIVAGIEDRIEQSLGAGERFEDKAARVTQRRLRASEEERELVTKRGARG